jgi:CBS domain containing-hemolysin-like protein
MVTIEDIIEALIGEIYDEHDESSVEEDCQVINDVTLIATGRMKISELEKLLDIEFDNYNKEEYETLSGLIMDTTGLIPKIGDVIKLHKNVKAEIVDADLRSIKKIKLHLVDL